MKKLQSNKGFTLVELIIVIAILAIIMLIAIPNFSGIQQRMQVRADKATAAQIGKAVRVWYTDYTTDPTLKKAAEDDEDTNAFLGMTGTIAYNGLEGIGAYCSEEYTPSSLFDEEKKPVADQAYYVGLVKDDNGAAYIYVEVAGGDNKPLIKTAVKEAYDGSKADVAFVESGAPTSTTSPTPTNP